jgi:hypothetical protein
LTKKVVGVFIVRFSCAVQQTQIVLLFLDYSARFPIGANTIELKLSQFPIVPAPASNKALRTVSAFSGIV